MVSWLPLYHDMGLVGFLAIPMTTGVDLVQAAPQDFMAHPGNWMQWISDYRGTATAGPELRLGAGDAGAEADDGPRPVVADAGAVAAPSRSTRTPSRRSSPPPRRSGSDPGGVFPAFGMAEVAIGGSFPPRGRGLVCDTVDRVVLERDRVAKPVDIDDPDDLELDGPPPPAARHAGARPGDARSSTPRRSRSGPSATSASC